MRKVNDIKNIYYKSPFPQSLFAHFHNADDFFDGAAKVVHSSGDKKRWKQKQKQRGEIKVIVSRGQVTYSSAL